MKLYLLAILVLAALVVAPSLAEETKQQEGGGATTNGQGDEPVANDDGGGATTNGQGDEPVANDAGGNGETTGDEPVENDPEEEKQQEQEQDEEQDEKQNEDEDEDEGEDEPQEEDPNAVIPEEFKDEVEQEKRRRPRFPQLSHHSCRILKKYGYCRHRGIARFCVKICLMQSFPGPCHDRLSRLSCRRIRFNYKGCRKHMGLVYCRKTCGHCGPRPLPIQCRRYAWLNDPTRRQGYNRGKKPAKCDNGIAQRWYRFGHNQGTMMPNRCTKPNHCGTHASGWLVGHHPRVVGQTVTRQVCFSWAGKCCYNARWWRMYIQVTNCRRYYVYYLRRPKACHYRYCGNRH